MEAKGELEAEVDDLEPRIERLRALYEQYFMGLEKMEPATLRGEVDRKLWALRKKRIQNTGVRYRLQMLIQRYNTYQQYWQRIMREMERGTYMRDVLRVARRIGSEEAVTIVGRRRAKMFRELAKAQEGRREKLVKELDSRAKASGDSADEEEIPLPDDALESDPGLDSEDEATPLAALGAAPARDPFATRPQQGETGFEDPSTWNLLDDSSSQESAPAPRTPPAARDLQRAGDDDAPTLPPPPPGPNGVRFSRPPIAPPPPPLPPRRPPPRPATAANGDRAGAQAANGAPRPAARAAAPADGASAGRSEGRLRRVYDEYVAAKRSSNEPTEGLTYEKLQKSLARQEEQLRAKHGDRQIEFEVVTQDGRTRIRPVVR
jgi:hypothetical protein